MKPKIHDNVLARRVLLKHARLHKVSFNDAFGRRYQGATAARHAAWRELFDAPHSWGYSRIARAFGMHHTTVMHALDKRPPGGCPCCGEPFESTTEAPMTFVVGVATQRAYRHRGRVCITQTAWVLRGESEAA
jgi:hypothetical protein